MHTLCSVLAGGIEWNEELLAHRAAVSRGFALPVIRSAGELPLGANVEGLLEYARGNPEFAAMRYEADAAAQRV